MRLAGVRIDAGRLRTSVVVLVVTATYAAVTGLTAFLATTSVGEPAFNPALGVALGMALFARRRQWAPSWLLGFAVTVGEWCAWLWASPPSGTLALSLAHGVAVVLGVEMALWLLKILGVIAPEPKALAVSLGPALVVGLSSAVVLLSTAHLLGYPESVFAFAGQWSLKDFLGVLLVTPVFLTVNQLSWRANGPTVFGEQVVVTALLLGSAALLFASPERSHTFPGSFVTIWIALRFGIGATSTAVLVIASVLSLATGLNHGPFAGVYALDWAQAFMGTYAVTSLMVSLLAAQRSRTLEQALLAQQRLARANDHDDLTGLFTRPYLERATAAAIAARPVGESWIALISIDLDDFASVNVRYGRSIADAAITHIGQRLQANLPRAACVARIGGDEYGLLFTEMPEESDAIAIAEQLRELVCVPVVFGTSQFIVTGSVGAAVTNDGDADQLLRDAEAALHDAKERGRNRLAIRTLRDRQRAQQEQQLLNRFPQALAEREFGCVYQPIVSLSGKAHGVEVLARWHHPEQGLLMPGDFLPVLQRSGVMGELSDYLFDMAIRQVHRWTALDAEAAPTWLSINVSADELIDMRLPRRIRRVLDASAVRPQHLMVEITEQTMVSFTADVRSQLEELRSMGVRIAVDDFGTGFSGLAYLTRLPIDVLKIDRQFLLADSDTRAHTLLRSVCALARDLGLFTIVEGVESSAELALAREIGADAAQGWYLGRPTSADQVLVTMPNGEAMKPMGGEGGI